MVFIETPRAGLSRLFAVAEIDGDTIDPRWPNADKLASWARFLGITEPPKTDRARLYYELNEKQYVMARDTEQAVGIDHAMASFFLNLDVAIDFKIRALPGVEDVECLASA